VGTRADFGPFSFFVCIRVGGKLFVLPDYCPIEMEDNNLLNADFFFDLD
jgi:hypothetical protein